MAFKEFKVKVGVDGTEVDTTIKTLEGFNTQIGDLQAKLSKLDLGSEEYKKTEKEIRRTEKALQQAKDANKGWLDTIASAPGLVGTFGQSLQGVGKAFGNIGMAIKTSLIGLLATIIASVVEKLKSFDGVMDPLNKVLDIWSATMGKLANLILPAVAAVVETVAVGITKLVNLFSSASSGGAKFGDILSDMADRTNDLDDATAEYQYQQSLSNAALAEAREVAADSTKSMKERRQAVLDAAKIEEQTAKEGKRIALEKARLMAQQMAVDMDLTVQEIDNLKKADAARLKSFITQQLQNKALNGEKKDALLQQLAQINEIDAASSKIGKKTAATLKGLDNEAAAAQKEANQRALDATKNRLNAQIELEKNKVDTDEKLLRELLEKKDALENKGTKKSKEELDLQKQNREKAIQDALKADVDSKKALADAADAKAKKEKEDQQKIDDDYIKSVKQKDANELTAAEILLEEKRRIYKEDSKEFKAQQDVITALRQKAIADEIEAIGKKKDQTDADKQRLIELGFENQKLTNQIVANNQAQVDSDKKKLEDQQNAKLKNDMDALEYELQKSETDYTRKLEILDAENTLLKEDFDKKIALAGDDVNKKAALELEYTKQKDALGKKREEIDNAEYANRIAIAQGTANALGALSELIGKDTLAGKALGISQALINTYVGASEAIKQKSTLPSPFDVITKVVNVATIVATGLKTVREITAVTVPTVDVPEVRIRKALGGVLSGPTHAMGGITTPFGELEGGEYVVNRTATQLFRPQLDQINGVGGNVDYQQSGFNGNITTSGQQPIIKTYVVASEMSSQQEMDRVIKDRSKI
jgi:hypothetical protein